MFIVPLRIGKVLDQQIRTKTWNSLREIYFFSQQKKVPFGKGGGSQYGLTSPGWTWKAVERKTNVSKWKKSLLLARLTEKIMKEFIDQNGIIREQRIKCYSYLYLHLLKPLFPFWVKLISSKIANYDSEYKHNLVVQKGSVELLHSRNYSTSKRLRITMYGILQKCARALSSSFHC